MFRSQAAIAVRGEKTKTSTQAAGDDFFYELLEDMPDLELGDGLLQTLGTNAEDLFNTEAPPLTKEEEEDEILKNLKEEYGFEDIKNPMDKQGEVPESIYFFYGGESENFVRTLEFIGLSPTNREFGAFLLSDLGRQVMTENKLSIHVESGDVFYNNHNTGENFYNFLLSQQNDSVAFVPKKFSYRRDFESCISNFLQAFSVDDQGKYNLLAFKNSKYLFYRFNDHIKAYGNPRHKLLYTRKMLNTVGLQKVEEKSRQFLIEKIIHGIKFESLYQLEAEKKPEIMETIESNYRIARRVYQQLYVDVSELFAKFVRSLGTFEIEDMNNNIRVNGWGIKKITEVQDSEELMNIFQNFYNLMGRLPLSNGLLVVPDGDAPPGEDRVNMRNLYELFKHTKSRRLVSLPFLRLI